MCEGPEKTTTTTTTRTEKVTHKNPEDLKGVCLLGVCVTSSLLSRKKPHPY